MNPNTSLAKNYTAFWSDVVPREHLVQIYPNDESFLDALEAFVCAGIEKGEVVILIATPAQLSALHHRLVSRGFDLDGARARKLYLTYDANEALQNFMIRDWPDESLLQHYIHRIVARAHGRRVRAFSGIHALLYGRGQSTAVLRLEQLWHKLCDRHELILFCAYPRKDFATDMESSMRAICATHSCVIS